MRICVSMLCKHICDRLFVLYSRSPHELSARTFFLLVLLLFDFYYYSIRCCLLTRHIDFLFNYLLFTRFT